MFVCSLYKTHLCVRDCAIACYIAPALRCVFMSPSAYSCNADVEVPRRIITSLMKLLFCSLANDGGFKYSNYHSLFCHIMAQYRYIPRAVSRTFISLFNSRHAHTDRAYLLDAFYTAHTRWKRETTSDSHSSSHSATRIRYVSLVPSVPYPSYCA